MRINKVQDVFKGKSIQHDIGEILNILMFDYIFKATVFIL